MQLLGWEEAIVSGSGGGHMRRSWSYLGGGMQTRPSFSACPGGMPATGWFTGGEKGLVPGGTWVAGSVLDGWMSRMPLRASASRARRTALKKAALFSGTAGALFGEGFLVTGNVTESENLPRPVR